MVAECHGPGRSLALISWFFKRVYWLSVKSREADLSVPYPKALTSFPFLPRSLIWRLGQTALTSNSLTSQAPKLTMLSSLIQGLGPFFRVSCSVEGHADQSPFDVYLLYLWILSNNHLQEAGMQHVRRRPAEYKLWGGAELPRTIAFCLRRYWNLNMLMTGRVWQSIIIASGWYNCWRFFLHFPLTSHVYLKHISSGS